MTPTSISNSDLTWETSKKFDIGFDLSLINRIHLTFDYYNEETSDALFEVSHVKSELEMLVGVIPGFSL